MLAVIAVILAVVAVIVIICSIWARGISSTTWEEIKKAKKKDETE